MTNFLKTRPYLSIAVLVLALFLPLIVSRTFSSAQTPGPNKCATTNVPAIVRGSFAPASASQQVGVLAFPQTKAGDQYIASLAPVTAPKVSASGGLASALSNLNAQFTNQTLLKQSLPSLYASMYGIGTDASGTFTCEGLTPGTWSFLAFQQAKPGALPSAAANSSVSVATGAAASNAVANLRPGVTILSGPAAAAAISQNVRTYYYSYAVIRPKDMQPVPTPTPKKGTTAPSAPPTYRPVVVHSFQPVANFPAGYPKV